MSIVNLTIGSVVLVASLSFSASAQQVEMKTQFEGDVTSTLSTSQVAISVDAQGLPAKTGNDIVNASADVARTLGLEPVDQERVAFAVKAKGRAPTGEAEARAIAELLGSGRVLLVRAVASDKDVELSVLGVNVRTGVSAQETRVVSQASLTAQSRAVVADVLAAIAVPPPPPPPQVSVEETPKPALAPAIAPPPPPLVQVPPPVPPKPVVPRPPRRMSEASRGAAVFGVALGAQAVGMALCYALWSEVEENERETEFMDWAIGYSVAIPFLSAAAGLGMANAKSDLKYNYGSLLLGTYVGSAVAFGLGAAAHYGLGDRPSESPFFWPATHVVLPLVLPAAGAAIFHRLGSRPKKETRGALGGADRTVAYTPPTLAVSGSARQGQTVLLNLGSLSF